MSLPSSTSLWLFSRSQSYRAGLPWHLNWRCEVLICGNASLRPKCSSAQALLIMSITFPRYIKGSTSLISSLLEHNPTDSQRQRPGHKPRLTFAQRCSCSVQMLYPLVIHWRGCVIKIFSLKRQTLFSDNRHLCFPVVLMPWQNPTKRKGCHEENTQCQNIDTHTRNARTRQKM